MSKEGKEKAVKLLKEILEISFPFCRHSSEEICKESIAINQKAHELLKLVEHREIE